ncbi:MULTISPECIES: hypothetical protein [Cupriavidus]|uniref:hypothetical protein n=1 Tax=Cupriavidus sp. SK-3 TaxID=1470558 RepID=UPI001267F7EA|nr:hypothetical protein [Cupriavidus sp. SK-3]
MDETDERASQSQYALKKQPMKKIATVFLAFAVAGCASSAAQLFSGGGTAPAAAVSPPAGQP